MPIASTLGPLSKGADVLVLGIESSCDETGVALVQAEGNVTLLQGGGLPCVPCSKAGCEDHLQSRSDCLVAITPQRVLAQAVQLLAGR